MLRHQFGDELLVHAAEKIRPWKIDFKEMLAQCVPERRVPADVDVPSNFCDHVWIERRFMLGHVQEPAERKQSTIAGPPIRWRQQQTADLTGPAMLSQQVQNGYFFAHAERGGRV